MPFFWVFIIRSLSLSENQKLELTCLTLHLHQMLWYSSFKTKLRCPFLIPPARSATPALSIIALTVLFYNFPFSHLFALSRLWVFWEQKPYLTTCVAQWFSMLAVHGNHMGELLEHSLLLFQFQIRSDQLLSRVRLFATPWITARQASLSITNSCSSLRLTSIESVMPSSHLILFSSPSPPAPNPSQHQSLSQWVNSSHEVAKVLEFQL